MLPAPTRKSPCTTGLNRSAAEHGRVAHASGLLNTMNHRVIAWPGCNSLVCKTALTPVSVRVRVESPVTIDASQIQKTGCEALCDCADAAGKLQVAATATVNAMAAGRMRRATAVGICFFTIYLFMI